MPTVLDATVVNSITKTCSKCGKEKSLDEFYSQKKHSKKRGEYIYYQPYCKECASQKSQEWLYDNIDRKRESVNKYYQSEKGKESKRRYRKKQKENNYEYFKQYQKKNLDKFREYSQKRRAIERNLTNDFTLEDWNMCLEYFNDSCAYCGESSVDHILKYNCRLQQEHVLPVVRGGEYTKNNIVPACKSCNSSKNDKDFLIWFRSQDFYSLEREEKVLFYLSQFNSFEECRGEINGDHISIGG